MNAIPTIDWTDLAIHQDLALLRSELRAGSRVELGVMENRSQRSMVTWILAAQGAMIATLGALVTVLTLLLA